MVRLSFFTSAFALVTIIQNAEVSSSSETGATGYSCPTLFNYYGDVFDCTKFYRCFWGEAYSFNCPDGTRWSQSLLTCDHESNVPCHDGPVVSKHDTPPITSTPMTESSYEEEESTEDCDDDESNIKSDDNDDSAEEDDDDGTQSYGYKSFDDDEYEMFDDGNSKKLKPHASQRAPGSLKPHASKKHTPRGSSKPQRRPGSSGRQASFGAYERTRQGFRSPRFQRRLGSDRPSGSRAGYMRIRGDLTQRRGYGYDGRHTRYSDYGYDNYGYFQPAGRNRYNDFSASQSGQNSFNFHAAYGFPLKKMLI